MKYEHKYFSEREEELISNSLETITAEDYVKWYGLYYIDKQGKVNKLHELYPEFWDEVESCDHYFYPASVVEFAKKRNLKIDYMSYAAICMRYLEDSESTEIHRYNLPLRKDLEEVLFVPEDGFDYFDSKSSFCSTFYLFPKHFSIQTCIESFSKADDIPEITEYKDLEKTIWCHWDLLRFFEEKHFDDKSILAVCEYSVTKADNMKVIEDFRIYLKKDKSKYKVEVYTSDKEKDEYKFDNFEKAKDFADNLIQYHPEYATRPVNYYRTGIKQK